MTIEQRLTDIRGLIAQNADLTAAKNNEAFGWKTDCEYLLKLVEEMTCDRDDMLDMLHRYARECDECGGHAEVIRSDGFGDPERDYSEPCGACEDIWALIKAVTPEPTVSPPASEPAEVEDDVAF